MSTDKILVEDENEVDDLQPDDGEELDFDAPMGHEDEDTFESDFEEELEYAEDEEPQDVGSLSDQDLKEMDEDYETWLRNNPKA